LIKVHVDCGMWSWKSFNNALSNAKYSTNYRYIEIYLVPCGRRGMTLKHYSKDSVFISLYHTHVFNGLCQLSYTQQIKLTCGSYSFENCAKLMLLNGL
jgi:hypothetical protein